MQLRVVRSRSVTVCVVVLLEFSITASHSARKVLFFDHLGNFLGLLDGVHQRSAQNLVLANSDDRRWRVGGHLQHGANGLNTLQSGESAVISTSGTTTLSVAENGGSGVQAQTVCEDILDGRARDLVELAVLRSLGDDNNCATLASLFAVLYKLLAISCSLKIYLYESIYHSRNSP